MFRAIRSRAARPCTRRSAAVLAAATTLLLIVPTLARANTVPGWTKVDLGASASVYDIDAVGPNDVWYVGESSNGIAAWHYDGSSVTEVPGVFDPQSSLAYSIEVVNPNDIWVGMGGVSFRHFNGSSWTTVVEPNGDPYAPVDDIDGVASNDVWAVARSAEHPLHHWNGTVWTDVPASFTGSVTFREIDAISSTSVYAVGTSYDGEFGAQPFVARWNGTSWNKLAVPATEMSGLEAVRAFANNDIYAAGWTQAAPGQPYRPLVLHWNGSSWTSETMPDLRGLSAQLYEIEGTSGSDLWAAGSASGPTLTMHRDAQGWELVPSPNQPGTVLVGLASTGPNNAWAGGSGALYLYGPAVVHDAALTLSATNSVIGNGPGISGQLSFTADALAVGRTITFQRTGPDGTVALPPVVTDGLGNFSFNDTTTARGDYTYEATFAGDDVWSPASASVTAKVYGYDTEMTVRVSSGRVTYGKSVTITVTMAAFTPGSSIEFADATHKPAIHLADVPLSVDGTAQLTVTPKATTAYRTTLADDPIYDPISDGAWIEVRGVVATSWANKDGQSGKYALYKFDTRCPAKAVGCPQERIQVKPRHPGANLDYILQVYLNGAWRFAADGAVRLNDSGVMTVNWVYPDRSVIGHPYRVQYDWGGDKDHLMATSPWAYFKVVR